MMKTKNITPGLLQWFADNRRDLAFRKDRDPYKIWVSEIMAQQTRIEAMLPYFERFIRILPDVKALSEADDDLLMNLWQGLGYYSRVRNMKKAAVQIMTEFYGEFPLEKEDLMKLCGIGDYTAGAISSIAGRRKASAIDGNVIRVFSRLYAIEEDPSRAKGKKIIKELVEASLPEAARCGDFNEALMEYGALLCTPKSPGCSQCVLSGLCEANKEGNPEKYPVRPEKKKRTIEKHEIWVWAKIKDGKEFVHVHRRPSSGLLAGLYEFDYSRPEKVFKTADLGEYVHIFSHKEWHMTGTLALISSEDSETVRPEKLNGTDVSSGFVPLEQAGNGIAIPSAFMPFLDRVKEILYEDADDKLIEEAGK